MDCFWKIIKNKYISVAIRILLCVITGIGLVWSYSFGSKREALLSGMVLMVFAGLLFYTVINYGKMYNAYKMNKDMDGFIYAIYLSVITLLMSNPLRSPVTQIAEFKRMIGRGVLDGVDVARRVNNFTRWFAFFAFFLWLYFLLFHYLKKQWRTDNQKKILKFTDNVVVIGMVCLLFRSVAFFSVNDTVVSWMEYSDYIILAVLTFSGVYIFLNLDEKIRFSQYQALMIACWVLMLPIMIVALDRQCSMMKLVCVQYITSIFVLILIKCSKVTWKKTRLERQISILTIAIAWLPFLTSFFIEMVTVLNQHNVYLSHLASVYSIIIIGWMLFAIVIALATGNKGREIDWKRYAYPILVFGMMCLVCQIPVTAQYNANIFESANSSILISDFFHFGDIPIVQHYGGHMMTGVWEGIIYGVLNNDTMGAVFSPYAEYVATIIMLAFYFLIAKVWNRDAALGAALLLPVYGTIAYWGLGIWVCLTVMRYIEKNTYGRAAVIWLAFIGCVLYRLDLGYAFFAATAAALIIYICITKNKKALKQLGMTLAGYALAGGLCWVTICCAKGINPVKRLLEFLRISSSNQNWGRSTIGDPGMAGFSWAYVIVPFAVIIGIVCLLCIRPKGSIREYSVWTVVMMLGFSYIFNYSRGVVRHSLAESLLHCSIWTAYMFGALLIAYLKKDKRWIFPVFAVLILANKMFLTTDCFDERAMLDQSVYKLGTYTVTWTGVGENAVPENSINWEDIKENKTRIRRVVWNSELENTIAGYRYVLDGLLEEDETFVDFINKTFVYSAVNRRDPAYVSQSPLQLAGEYTQERFIEEIQGIPVVLMPCDGGNIASSEMLDDISNSYRNYKVAEYIYQNYVPLCAFSDEFAVWCLTEKYDVLSKKVAEKLDGCRLIEYGYDGPYLTGEDYSFLPGVHEYTINQLPLIWGEKDVYHAVDNPVLTRLQYHDGIYGYDLQTEQLGSKGNYLKVHIGLDADDMHTATLDVGCFVDGNMNTKYRYHFAVKPGEHDYLLRVSSDYYWYYGATNAVSLVCDTEIRNVSIEVLAGD